ncbi:MAG: hypothetical protein A2408_04150 [Candidatus Yonathbacteria bacterium RIFOXYC1_FULL_52_10]|uniref:SGNH hydrolase-type esterase domain-containing protein n=1 Tax=Candidatus Yonathbacteria bacterium RIFOXYD1_FULL_52_36 TaxID=1802730 RepID=A0A1G2SL14_9BACT|nr:MAG: hypothetical protein A2408_04150 [Candidatus Yonathbacteria bacterium RIFOXYC1_FULL_52_10]OHA85091.1 MAG: hypothetical protein A2591_02045 [Candidatus Yonathbacteria bacterium RIFOXYD1_FULL_52_36]
MKYAIGIGIGALVLGGALFLMRGEEVYGYPPLRGTTTVFFGDSLVLGVGATAGNDLASLLEKRLNVPIVNAGKSGDTTTMARARFSRDVLAHDPRVVLILLGGNDFLKHVPREETFTNLKAMIDELHARGTMVVLLGVRGGIIGDSYESDFDTLAEDTHVVYVANVLEGIIGNPEYLSDAIHPNDLGYARIAERVYQKVQPYRDAFQIAGQ